MLSQTGQKWGLIAVNETRFLLKRKKDFNLGFYLALFDDCPNQFKQIL